MAVDYSIIVCSGLDDNCLLMGLDILKFSLVCRCIVVPCACAIGPQAKLEQVHIQFVLYMAKCRYLETG